jgi:hypothetical protein
VVSVSCFIDGSGESEVDGFGFEVLEVKKHLLAVRRKTLEASNFQPVSEDDQSLSLCSIILPLTIISSCPTCFRTSSSSPSSFYSPSPTPGATAKPSQAHPTGRATSHGPASTRPSAAACCTRRLRQRSAIPISRHTTPGSALLFKPDGVALLSMLRIRCPAHTTSGIMIPACHTRMVRAAGKGIRCML